MTQADNKHPYKDRKYKIVPYDPEWPAQFEKYASKIDGVFRDARIEHIGSTSVPGMSGKPCIDVLVVISDLGMAERRIQDMERTGFEYAGRFVTDDSLLFRVTKDNAILANIHFFPAGHPHIKEMLGLRDYLRSHPEEAVAYSKIKKDLYSIYADDYGSYRRHKDQYMDELRRRADGYGLPRNN